MFPAGFHFFPLRWFRTVKKKIVSSSPFYLIKLKIPIPGSQITDQCMGIMADFTNVISVFIFSWIPGFHLVYFLLKTGFQLRIIQLCFFNFVRIRNVTGSDYRRIPLENIAEQEANPVITERSKINNNPIEIRVVTFLTNTSCAFLAILVARFTDRIEVSFVSFAIFPARYAIWYSRLILCFCINFLISFFCISGCSSRYFWYWYLDALFQALCSKRFSLCIWLRFSGYFYCYVPVISTHLNAPAYVLHLQHCFPLRLRLLSDILHFLMLSLEQKTRFSFYHRFPCFLSKYKWYFTFAFCSSFVFLV